MKRAVFLAVAIANILSVPANAGSRAHAHAHAFDTTQASKIHIFRTTCSLNGIYSCDSLAMVELKDTGNVYVCAAHFDAVPQTLTLQAPAMGCQKSATGVIGPQEFSTIPNQARQLLNTFWYVDETTTQPIANFCLVSSGNAIDFKKGCASNQLYKGQPAVGRHEKSRR